MMADSVEAASRSLPEYTEESISTLVDKIIDTQVSEGYFKECPITFKDIATVKALFKEKTENDVSYSYQLSGTKEVSNPAQASSNISSTFSNPCAPP